MKWKILFSMIFLVGLSLAKNDIDPNILVEIFGTPPPITLDQTTQITKSREFPLMPNKSQSLEEQIMKVFGTPSSSPLVENCTCVNYYLCSDGIILEDGIGIIDVRMPGVCDNRLETCCSLSSIVNNGIPYPPKPPIHQGCGYRHSQGIGIRITGNFDNEAQFAEFPWMVAILRRNITSLNYQINQKYHYQCGGSLIHFRVVLTAAHCVARYSAGTLVVRAGEWDTQTINEPISHQNRNVSRIIIHPNFHSQNLRHDYALLILSESMKQEGNVDIVCLPHKNEVLDNKNCIVSGWGKDVFGKKGEYQAILKRVELPVVNNHICQQSLRMTRLGQFFQLHDSFMCAGGEFGRDACMGDGGSPLVCPLRNDPDRYLQAGIVSWGIDCGREGIPGVYANVAYARDWIDQQIAEAFEII